MANWQSELDLSDLWKSFNEGEIVVNMLSHKVSNRLKDLKVVEDKDIIMERDDIADEFEMLGMEDNPSIDDFDNVLERLYDWGDISLDGKCGGKKVCWIKTL